MSFLKPSKLKITFTLILLVLLPMFIRIEWTGSSRVDYALARPIAGFMWNLTEIPLYSIPQFIVGLILSYLIVCFLFYLQRDKKTKKIVINFIIIFLAIVILGWLPVLFNSNVKENDYFFRFNYKMPNPEEHYAPCNAVSGFMDAINSLDPQKCLSLENNGLGCINRCLKNVAIESKDFKVCGLIDEDDQIDLCYSSLARELKDISICEEDIISRKGLCQQLYHYYENNPVE
ncbi:MAG: hypothetical protein V1698_00120 [bacterium]